MMIQELVHTSIPKGLRPGSRGFCTVAMTSGMSVTLSEALESLSGYRFQFDPAGPQLSLNQPTYSLLKLTIGGRRHYVVSRIAPCQADYTNRPNRIAHHLALTDSDLVQDGPTSVLLREDNFLAGWDGEPALLEPRRSLHTEEVEPAPCGTWQTVAGDAAWAGELIRLTRTNGSIVYVLYPAGCNVLALVNEAMALLPSHERWKYSFHTAFPEEGELACADCVWRFLAATPKARVRTAAAINTPVIDLTQRLRSPQPSDEADAAREGRSLFSHEQSAGAGGPIKVTRVRPRQPPPPGRKGGLAEDWQEETNVVADPGVDWSGDDDGQYAIGGMPEESRPRSSAGAGPRGSSRHGSYGDLSGRGHAGGSRPAWLIPAAAFAVGVLLGGSLLWLSRPHAERQTAQDPSPAGNGSPRTDSGALKNPAPNAGSGDSVPAIAKGEHEKESKVQELTKTAATDRESPENPEFGADSGAATKSDTTEDPGPASPPPQPAGGTPPPPTTPEAAPIEPRFEWKLAGSGDDARPDSDDVARHDVDGYAALTGLGSPGELRASFVGKAPNFMHLFTDGTALGFEVVDPLDKNRRKPVGKLTVELAAGMEWIIRVEQQKQDALNDVSISIERPGKAPLILDLYPKRKVRLLKSGDRSRSWVGTLSTSQYHRLLSARSLTSWNRTELSFVQDFSVDGNDLRPDSLVLTIEQGANPRLVLKIEPALDRLMPSESDIQKAMADLEQTQKDLDVFAQNAKDESQLSKDHIKRHADAIKNVLALLKKEDHLNKLAQTLRDQLQGPGILVSNDSGPIIELFVER